MKVLLIILPFVIYILGGWIAKDIYFSMNPITDNTTWGSIYTQEIFVYACVVAAYNFICGLISANDTEGLLVFALFFCGIPLGAAYLVANILPMSEGAVYLNAIVCIGSMIWAGFVAND